MVYRYILNGLGYLFAVAAVLSFFYEWDTSRVVYKKLKAKSPYLYEEYDPAWLETNPADLIQTKDIAVIRENLRNTILGDQDISQLQPIEVHDLPYPDGFLECWFEYDIWISSTCFRSEYSSWPEVAQVRELIFETSFDQISNAVFFIPTEPQNKLVIYHHGYAGTFHEQHVWIHKLITEGYHVLAYNTPDYGDKNRFGRNGVVVDILLGRADKSIQQPLRIFFEPLYAGLNHVMATESFHQVNMVGLSGGAWATSIMAAMDERIENSYPVAGVMPVYLRRKKEQAPTQFNKEMLASASYLDMFALAADTPKRSQLQIFNKYDRCCFNNTRGKIYEKAVQDRLVEVQGGEFEVLIDTTHPRHKISDWAFDRILAHMEAKS